MPQRDDIPRKIGISGVKTILHGLHMKGQGHGQRGNTCLGLIARDEMLLDHSIQEV